MPGPRWSGRHEEVRHPMSNEPQPAGQPAPDGGSYEHLIITRRADVAYVTLNRPEVHNAFNARLIAELSQVFTALPQDEALRAIVLAGAGRSFCAGADLNWMRSSLDFTQADNHADALKMADMLATIDACACPVVARIHGAALGGGVGLAAVCDIVIAADNVKFGFTEARLGIAPAVISPFAVRKIGASAARALFTTAERFSAARAREIGLAHTVVPEAELDAAVAAALIEIVRNGPHAVRASKRLARTILAIPMPEAREMTAQTIAALRVSAEGQEGIRSFLEKRSPSWMAADV
jgi:methylglutaconyl-CoA hydratase